MKGMFEKGEKEKHEKKRYSEGIQAGRLCPIGKSWLLWKQAEMVCTHNMSGFVRRSFPEKEKATRAFCIKMCLG